MQFKLFFFNEPAYLQKTVLGLLLSIVEFWADGHYGLIVSLRVLTLSRHVITLNQ